MTISANELGFTFHDETEWKSWRDTVIGASDSAMALNLSPYGSAWQLFMRKKGRLPPVTENDAMRLGKFMEPAIMLMHEYKTGEKLINRQLCVTHPEFPFIASSLDSTTEELVITEIKNVGARSAGQWGDDGVDMMPLHVRIQVHHQLITSPWAPRAQVVANVAGDVRVYPIERDNEIADGIVRGLTEFKRRLDEDDPPPMTEPDQEHIGKLRPSIEATCYLDEFHQNARDIYVALGHQIESIKDQRKAIQNQIILAASDHVYAQFPDGKILSRKIVNRRGYFVDPTSYPDFRILNPKD